MTGSFPDTRSFRDARHCVIVLPRPPAEPERQRGWHDLVTLLQRESPELGAELGAPVTRTEAPVEPVGPCLLLGPATHNRTLRSWREACGRALPDAPCVAIDARWQTVVIGAPVHEQVSQAIQLLRTATASGDTVLTSSFAQSTDDLLRQVDAEVRRTFPNLTPGCPTEIPTCKPRNHACSIPTISPRCRRSWRPWATPTAEPRILDRRTLLGSIRFSTITGELAPAARRVSGSALTGQRRLKPVRFLIDPLCYSATEDFLPGLQGQPHIELVGQRTGGGSGRPRSLALRPHINLTICTALMFDRQERCIEGNGIAPDTAIEPNPGNPAATLDRALRW